MATCSLLVESLDGSGITEDFLRGYLEAFGVPAREIRSYTAGRCIVVCNRCYDILDRLTSINLDHQKSGHKGRKLKFRLMPKADNQRYHVVMGRQPSTELSVSGFDEAEISIEDLECLFGLYGDSPVVVLNDGGAVIEVC